jgi:hypothetical protein
MRIFSGRATVAVVVGAFILGGCGGGGISPTAGAPSVNQLHKHIRFSYTDFVQYFTVPKNVKKITVGAVGAGMNVSQCSNCTPVPLGEEVTAALPVTPGEVLYVNVGGSQSTSSGAGGFNGGGSCGAGNCGGAGASDVREGGTDLGNRVIVAGGAGGYAEVVSSGINFSPINGGDAGFTTGSPGENDGNLAGSGGGGGAQTQISNGGTISGYYEAIDGLSGTLGVGGNAPNNENSGAGGGGYYGGGSGAVFLNTLQADTAGAGGGGSSFVESSGTNVSHVQAKNAECDTSNNGCITISW